MALEAPLLDFSDLWERSGAYEVRLRGTAGREKNDDRPVTVSPAGKPLDTGMFRPEIGSFRLHLAAEGKAAKTVRTYTDAVAWFAAHLIPRTSGTSWEQVDGHDAQRWLVHPLARYSDAYASKQCPAR